MTRIRQIFTDFSSRTSLRADLAERGNLIKKLCNNEIALSCHLAMTANESLCNRKGEGWGKATKKSPYGDRHV